MTPEDLVHASVVLISIAALLLITFRGLRSLRTPEDSRLTDRLFASTPSMPQLVVALKHLRMILLSWEYMLLVLFLALLSQAMAAGVKLPIATASLPSQASVYPGASPNMPVMVVYSARGLDTSVLNKSPELEVFVSTLGEPAVVKLSGKTLRAFSLIIVECEAGHKEVGALESLCGRSAVAYASRSSSSSPIKGSQEPLGTVYIGDLEVEVRIEGADLLLFKPLTSIPRIGARLNTTLEAARAVGALILVNPGDPLRRATTTYEEKPELVLLENLLPEKGLVERLFEAGASEIYARGLSGEAVIYYVERDLLDEIRSSALAGLAAGVAMILFNRSVMPRILRSAEATAISGSTYWVSRTIPILSLVFSELMAIVLMAASYLASYNRSQGQGLWGSFTSPPGLLLASAIMIAISSAHAGSFRGAQESYLERGIMSRVFSIVAEDLEPDQVLNMVSRCFDDSEFFTVLEKETLKGRDSSSARFRLIYTYSIGVGVDIEIYISRGERGSLVEVEAEPWSIDESRSGYMESIARLALSRIAGVIAVESSSRSGL